MGLEDWVNEMLNKGASPLVPSLKSDQDLSTQLFFYICQ
jgi:hypothetical protein